MNDQVNHLQQLVEQRNTLATDLESLTTQTTRTRELALKTQGAIEYLEAIGVKLPEPEPEAEVSETEVVEEG
jgi:prefoldin subunit 5